MKAYQLDEKEARRVVADWEENRSKFLSRFTFSDHNDPGVYTMVVNTSLVSLDQAEDMIVDLVQSRDAVAQ
jgi:cytidylate kinase